MALRTLVKVGKVNNLSDARYCAGMGVGMLGFVIQPGQPGFVPLEEFTALTSWLEGPSFVGEFGDATVSTIRAQAQAYEVHAVQVTRPAVLAELEGYGWDRILVIDIDKFPNDWEEEIAPHAVNAEYFLLVSGTGADLTDSDYAQLDRLTINYPILIGYGITPENVMELIDDYQPRGIALLGGNEIRPGFKSFDDLADVLELLEQED